MNRLILALLAGSALISLEACTAQHDCNGPESALSTEASTPPKPVSFITAPQPGTSPTMLGNFSVSLAVKDLAASRAFYEKLGFQSKNGDGENWIVLQNETSTIGLFQGMFDKNTLTFNPGWDRTANTLTGFADVRDIQRSLKSKGLKLLNEADESTSGPAFLMLLDPDGNPILLDQHVASPKR